MTLQETTDFFSKPRHKDLTLIFDAIDKSHIIINDVETSLQEGYNLFELSDEDSYYSTEIVFTFIRYQGERTPQIIERNFNVEDIGIYTGRLYDDLTIIENTEIDGNLLTLSVGLSENRDIFCVDYGHIGSPEYYYKLYYLSVYSEQDAIVVYNDSIIKESLAIEDSLCATDEELHFGRCEAKSLSLSLALDPDIKIKNRWFRAILNVDAPDSYLVDNAGNRIVDSDGNYIVSYKNGNSEPFELGRFKVFSDKLRNDRRTRDIVCYDALYDIINTNVKPCIDGLSFPMSVEDLRNSLFTYLGITQTETDLINDRFMVKGQFGEEPIITGQSIIESICEFNGVFGKMNEDGEFEYLSIYASVPVEYPFYVDDSGEYEDYVTDFITGVQIIKGDGSVSAISCGSPINAYKLQDNLILRGSEDMVATRTFIEYLFGAIRGISYRPFTISTFGNPVLPVGTWVTFNTKNKTITSLVMSKTLNGIQSMRDNIEAYGEKRLRELEL